MTDNNLDIWYKNPNILFKNIDQMFPSANMSIIEKNNSIARLALFLLILFLLSSMDKKWLCVPMFLFLLSYYYHVRNNKELYFNIEDKEKICTRPTLSNPFMNYTLGDAYKSNNRPPACNYENVKKDMRQKFRSTIYADPNDIWGKNISDRNFYIMPNTNIVNNQVEFANWCYNMKESGECKTLGSNCLKYRDPRYHRR
jgi:hypothetical protein